MEESGGYKRKPVSEKLLLSLQLITSQSSLLVVLSLLHCRSLSSGAATLSVSLLLFTLLCCSFTVTLHCCYSPSIQAAHSPLLLFIWCCSFTVTPLLLLSFHPSCSLSSAAARSLLLSATATLHLPKLLTLLCCCSSGATHSLSSPLLLLSFRPSCSLSSAARSLSLHCSYSPPAQAAHSPLLLFIWCCSFTVILHCCYSPSAQAAHSPLLLLRSLVY